MSQQHPAILTPNHTAWIVRDEEKENKSQKKESADAKQKRYDELLFDSISKIVKSGDSTSGV